MSAQIDALCQQLDRIAQLLEKGDATAATAIVAEMEETFASPPLAATPEELGKARALLGRCAVLEQELRQKMMLSFWRLGAARKSRIYRLR